jgi:NTE family protein
MQNQPFFDGGLRDVAPLRMAIREKADSVVCILCQPENPGFTPIQPKNLIKLTERVFDIMADEIERNDIEQTERINHFVPEDGSPAKEGPYKGKRKINLCIIRPVEVIRTDITRFTTADIRFMLRLGYDTAQKQLDLFSFQD